MTSALDPSGSIGAAISELVNARSAGATREAMADAAGFTAGTLKTRLDTGVGWRISEVFGIARLLSIPDDHIAAVLFPGRGSLHADLVRAEAQVVHLQRDNSALRAGRYEAQSVFRDILEKGEWSVSALPVMGGPTPYAKVVTGVRMAAVPLDPKLAGRPNAELRAALMAHVPSLAQRVTWPAVDGPDARPSIPGVRGGDTQQREVVDFSVEGFQRNREPAGDADRTRVHMHDRGVLVLGTSTGSWATSVATLIGRSLGWGISHSRALAKSSSVPSEVGDGPSTRRWMLEESASQLRNVLLTSGRHPETVYSHWGAPDEHPIVQALELAAVDPEFPRLPYIVLLREDDALIDEYAKRMPSGGDEPPSQRADRMRAARDRLWRAVSTVDEDHRMIVKVRNVEAASGDLRSEQLWMRSVNIAHQVLAQLLGRVPLTSIKNRKAQVMMAAADHRSWVGR